MVYETWMEYNDKLISTGLFSCAHCKNILIPPVILSEKYGNVCTPCYQHLSQNTEIGTFLENQTLSKLLQELYFPCKYKDQDCSEKLKFADLKQHEEECSYRTMTCIFSTTCPWVGRKMNLMKHLLEIHKDKTLNNADDKFIIETGIRNDNDSMNILQTSSGLFLVRIKCLPAEKTLYYKIYDYEEKQSKYECTLKIESRQSLVFFKTVLKICHDIESLSSFDKMDSTEVPILLLEESLKTEDSLPLKSIVKVACKNEEVIMESSMLNHMICPECNKLLRPPIYQCFSGHSICSSCKHQLTKCSSCNENFGDTRNYTLETLAYKIRYPCQFEANGCRVKAPLSSNHEQICDYQEYNCFMKKCNFKATHVELMDHLREQHKNFCYKAMETVYFKKSLCKQQEAIVTRMCIINYNTIFKMTVGHDATHTHWGVNMISTYNDQSTFVYEVAIYCLNTPQKKLIRQGILTHKQVYIFSINKDELPEFLDGDILNFYFRVVKKF